MASSTRTFRVFVSSTFSDLKAERNALQERVFPRLRELADSHGSRFQAIDLRWGVSEEAALDQQTMKICLGEIARCQKTSPRPNFIILLGDRYGWRPLPYEVPVAEFEQIIKQVSEEEKALLTQWYRRDDNAVPAVYCLLSRSGEFVEYTAWEQVEIRLHQILETTVEKLSLSPDAKLKYAASATQQEIMAGALKVTDAREHVFGFFREIEGMPQDESSKDFRDADVHSSQQQAELKVRLKKQLGENIHDYRANWQGEGVSLDHIDQLCEDVYAELSKVIQSEISHLETVDPLDKEIAAHETFGKDRARVFLGRKDLLKSIAEYIQGTDKHTLAIWGVSGSGKSALMAKAVEQASGNKREIIHRFIGATPDSSNGRALLESLCQEISHRYGKEESSIPSEYKDLVQEFPKRLASASPEKPLVLFLDALDQLSEADNARNLVWLPSELPPNVRLIVSTLPGECLKSLAARIPAQNRLEVQPMSVENGKAILGTWFKEIGRKLQETQEQFLLGKFHKCALPLYLKLAFEEAKLWKSYDAPAGLSGDIPGILRDLFKRLSLESNHGNMLVSHGLGYLAAAKNGLSEDELLDVLSLDKDMLADFQRRSPKSPKSDRLPIVIWSRLYFDLEPYLTERSADGTSLFAFYHRQMSEAVTAQYLAGKEKLARHSILADYFELKADPERNHTWNGGSIRGLVELPFQLTGANRLDDVSSTLTDFKFLEHKAAEVGVMERKIEGGKPVKTYTGVLQLMEDYERALAAMPGGEVETGDNAPLILTALETRKGLVVYCPVCNKVSPIEKEVLGKVIACPQESCGVRLKINPFTVKREV